MPDLAGKTVLVTGAAQGLGAAIARHLSELGASLILFDRQAEALARTASDLPRARAETVDLSDAADTERALSALPDHLDGLIHNAAILPIEPVRSMTFEGFRATLAVGLDAGFLLARAAWPRMAGGGSMIFVSSRSGIEGFANEGAYCAAKHGLEGLSKCLAIEGRDAGILSVTVTPGMYMQTPMSDANYPPELKAKWVDPIRLAPAFAHLIATRPMALSGQRLDAWALSQEVAP